MYLCADVFFVIFVSFHIGLILGFPLSIGTIDLSLFEGEGGREGGRGEGGGKGGGRGKWGRRGEGGGRGGRGEGGGEGGREGKKHLEV